MPGQESFSNPFEGSQRNGASSSRNQAAIGTGRVRAGSTVNRIDGHSPTAQSNSISGWSDQGAIRMRKLPTHFGRENVRGILLFASDLVSVDMMPSSKEDRPYQTAWARLESSASATQAAQLLNGKSTSDDAPPMIVEVIHLTPGGSVDVLFPEIGQSADGAQQRQNSRFDATFQPFRDLDRISPPRADSSSRNNLDGAMADGVSPTFRSPYPGSGAYGAQSPIGHSLERQHVSGRSMIQEDGADDETNQLMQDPGSFMAPERQLEFLQQGRRATAPHIALSGRMGNLSINSAVGSATHSMPSQVPSGGMNSPRHQLGLQSPGGTPFSPPSATGMGMYGNSFSNVSSPTNSQYQPFQRNMHSLPPVNPADQNPPCNTLYVGNLPMDTQEDELKSLFSRVRGFRRLCFRMKNNGPMCFVEFEDTGAATRALKDMYGTLLSNSVRGGIRLSFSKNPLGVRGPSQQNAARPNSSHTPGAASMSFISTPGGYSVTSQGFATANGPPPGLPAPQGFSQPSQRSASIAAPNGIGLSNGVGNGSRNAFGSVGGLHQSLSFGDAIGRHGFQTNGAPSREFLPGL